MVGLRDRAFLGVLVYSFARVSAAVSLRVARRACRAPQGDLNRAGIPEACADAALHESRQASGAWIRSPSGGFFPLQVDSMGTSTSDVAGR